MTDRFLLELIKYLRTSPVGEFSQVEKYFANFQVGPTAPTQIRPDLFLQGSPGFPLKIERRSPTRTRTGCLAIQRIGEGRFDLDDEYDSTVLYKDGQSELLGPGEGPWPVSCDFLGWFAKYFLVLAEPFTGKKDAVPTHLEVLTEARASVRLGANGWLREELLKLGGEETGESVLLASEVLPRLQDLRIPFKAPGVGALLQGQYLTISFEEDQSWYLTKAWALS